jgi:hypothetical protein
LVIRKSSPLLLQKVYQSTKAYAALEALVAAVASPDASRVALQVLVTISDARSVKLLRAISSRSRGLLSGELEKAIYYIEARNSAVETLADQRVHTEEGIDRMLKYLADNRSDWGKGQAVLFHGAPVSYPPILFRLLRSEPEKFTSLAKYLVETHAVSAVFWRTQEIIAALVDCYEMNHPAISGLADEVLMMISTNFARPGKPYTREKWLRWAEDPIRYLE